MFHYTSDFEGAYHPGDDTVKIEMLLKDNERIAESESFQSMMDDALDKLVQIDVTESKEVFLKNYHMARKCVEDVLCYSMSIAQVMYSDDYKIIRGSSKSVLSELESLFAEINRVNLNIAMCNLSIDSCYDKLCSLERKVNVAVLRLSLKVFSQYQIPLNKLRDSYINALSSEALDGFTTKFDLHVDRIMQIGCFAISSTSDVTSNIKMKNCLASLEALETELVPSLNSISVGNASQGRNYAVLLERYWRSQADNLRDLVYTVIDPFAMCQVVYEEVKQHIEKISINCETDNLSYSDMFELLEECTVLVSIVSASGKDIDFDNVEKIEKIGKDIRDVIHEIRAAADILLLKNNPTKVGNERILKRCKILKGLVRLLLLSLSEDEVTEHNENKLVFKKDLTKQNEKASVSNKMVNESLDHIIAKSKEMIKDRSILYKTTAIPDKGNAAVAILSRTKCNKKPMPLSKLVHLRNLQFSYSLKAKDDTSLDLQLTDILADLENISTFNIHS